MTGDGATRIGIFGGTFDPPHVGHVQVAADVADHLELDRILWIPAAEPPHKSADTVSPSDVRLEMVRRAAEADPRFEVSTVELERAGPSYTLDTVRTLRARYPDAELFLIIGADEFRVFDTWHRPDEIVEQVRLAVMDREGTSAEAVGQGMPGREEAVFVPVRRVDVSSTALRSEVREGRDVAARVPLGVAAIIEREGLYSAS